MRRTHIMHPRDNRRYHHSHFAERDERDPRTLAWHDRADGARVMTLDGEAVALVKREPVRGWFGWFISPDQPMAEVADVAGEDGDQLRLFFESHFAHQRAA